MKTVASYVRSLPPLSRSKVKSIRAEILAVIPGAEESISYGIPVFKRNGTYVIYVAAWKHHVALYPIPRGTESFNKAVGKYRGSKSSVHFPLDAPLPLPLIRRIIRVCLKRSALKQQKRSSTIERPVNR